MTCYSVVVVMIRKTCGQWAAPKANRNRRNKRRLPLHLSCAFRRTEFPVSIHMDVIDLEILKCLRENSRINASVIGERVDMSVSAVIERMRKLDNSGVIRKYTLVLDSTLIGLDVLAYVSVSLEHPKYNETFEKAINSNPHVVECHYITGDFDFLLKILTESIDALTRTLNDIKGIHGVSLTRTLIVLSTSKSDYCVLPDSAPFS